MTLPTINKSFADLSKSFADLSKSFAKGGFIAHDVAKGLMILGQGGAKVGMLFDEIPVTSDEEMMQIWAKHLSEMSDEEIEIVNSLCGKVPAREASLAEIKTLRGVFDVPDKEVFPYPLPCTKEVFPYPLPCTEVKKNTEWRYRHSNFKWAFEWAMEDFTPKVMLEMYKLGWYDKEKTQEKEVSSQG